MSNLKPYWWRPLDLQNNLLYYKQLVPWLNIQKFNRGYFNFGDELNTILLSNLFPNQIHNRVKLFQANFSAIGSIIERLDSTGNADFTIWGSGFRSEKSIFNNNHFRVLAVRGKFSASKMKISKNVAIGDPAILMSVILPKSFESGSKKPVFAPHFSFFYQKKNKYLISQISKNGYQILWPNTNPSTGLEVIRDASVVISSALHPLIVADSYNIPAIKVINTSIFETDFKYQDYLSIFKSNYLWPEVEISNLLLENMDSSKVFKQAYERSAHIQDAIISSQKELLESLQNV